MLNNLTDFILKLKRTILIKLQLNANFNADYTLKSEHVEWIGKAS
jgi:hypothetical protein